MKVFLLTIGTRGDVQPFVALGVGLAAAGHAVTLCTSARFEAFAAEHGLRFAPLSDEFLGLLDTPAAKTVLEKRASPLQVLRSGVALWRQAGPLQHRLLEESWHAARSAAPDVIVFHPKGFGAPHFADHLGVPALLALLQPIYVPTAARPAMGFPALRLGGTYNRFTHHLVCALTALGTSGYLRAWRAVHGLRRARSHHPLCTPAGRPLPVLHAVSPHVVPAPPDWPAEVVTTGYWFLERDVPPLSERLRAFLEAGPPPVYVGFGSMAGRDPERTARVVVEALTSAGVRGVVASGWGGMRATSLPETILAVDEASHEALFPRVAAVVHHGGAGTTAAGLRAGRPTVVCPFFGDQPFWGRRVHALGVGPPPLPQKRLTAEALAAALRTVTTDRAMQAHAAALGERIRAEDGVGRAVAVLERVAAEADAP